MRFVQFDGHFREFEQSYTRIDVGGVGPLVLIHLLAHVGHLLAPAVGLRGVVVEGDAAIEPVLVQDVEPALELGVALLEACHRLGVEAALVFVGALERAGEPVVHGAFEPEPFEGPGEEAAERLLADVLRLPANALAAVAVVVDVLAALKLANEHALVALVGTGAAVDEAAERELVLLRRGGRGAALFTEVLHLLPKLRGDQARVAPLVPGAEPAILALVERVSQDEVDGAHVEGPLRLPRHELVLVGVLHQVVEGVPPGGVQLEHPTRMGPALGIDVDDPLAVGARDVDVPEGRGAGPDALVGLLAQALAYLLAEIVDVVLGHQHLDAVDELLVGARVFGKDHRLLHEVDFEVHPLQLHVVGEVAVEPVGLLDQEHLALRVDLEPRHHLAEAAAPGPLRGFHVGELLHHAEAPVGGVAPKQLLLRRDAEALLLLVL